jgi:hypothetical protein
VLGQALGGKAGREVATTAPGLAAGVKAQRMGEGGRDLLVGGGRQVFGGVGQVGHDGAGTPDRPVRYKGVFRIRSSDSEAPSTIFP